MVSLHLAQIRLGSRVYTKMGQGKARQGETHQPLPMIGSNLTPWEWMRWKLRWAAYKRCTRLMNEYVCIDHLWGSFSNELESAVLDDLDRGFDIDTIEEQFLKRVRRLAVSIGAKVAQEAEVETKEVLVETPQAGGSITNQAMEITKSSTHEQPLQQQKQPQQQQEQP